MSLELPRFNASLHDIFPRDLFRFSRCTAAAVQITVIKRPSSKICIVSLRAAKLITNELEFEIQKDVFV